MRIPRLSAAALGIAAGYVFAVRPRLVCWGATAEEVRRPFPGADLVPGGSRSATMAVTIDAPPSRVWPWLVQMGVDRGGWYSWDRLDNFGRRSAERILLEPSHWVMQTRQFGNLKRRAERDVAAVDRPPAGPPIRALAAAAKAGP
jgi:hypothetical protein